MIPGALKADVRSAGWEVRHAIFLIKERRTRCILGLDLQIKVGISVTQKTVPKEKLRFDVLLCEQSEGWKEKFYSIQKGLFDQQGRSINNVVNTIFHNPLCPIQEKSR